MIECRGSDISVGDAEYLGYECEGATAQGALLIVGRTYCHGFLFLAGTSVLADVFPLPQLADYREAWMLSGVAVAGAWIGCRGVVLRFTGVKEDKQDQQVRR